MRIDIQSMPNQGLCVNPVVATALIITEPEKEAKATVVTVRWGPNHWVGLCTDQSPGRNGAFTPMLHKKGSEKGENHYE
jgi:hypothetical protein